MTRLHEEIETPLPLDVAFPFVADFANSSRWDPGVGSSEAIDPGPAAVGSRYRLMVRMGGRLAPMEYRVSVLEPMRRVVLAWRRTFPRYEAIAALRNAIYACPLPGVLRLTG